ncbi:hypothetical protein V2J09_007656 [Rumex salicifolius]
MLQPKADPGNGTAANGAHLGGAGAGSGISALGNDESKSRGGGSDELGSGGGGGNRWPREETLALLQIRSDMDGLFRDSSHKGPLWDEVSRKLAELGFRRSSKKCREKFENVYKYHRRTKDGRSGKSDGKTYRFFDQLEALEASHPSSSTFAVPIAMAMPPPRPPLITTSSPIQPVITPANHLVQQAPAPLPNVNCTNPMTFPGSPSSSSSTSSDEEIMTRSRKKRKWKEFFKKLIEDVMVKQEELEKKLLEAMERRENEHRIREESWKAKEIARLKQEREILVHERSVASAKEAALISYLQKLSDHQHIPLPPAILQPQPQPPPPPTTPTFSAQFPTLVTPISKPQENRTVNPSAAAPAATAQIQDNGVLSPSRWPKEEIEALIKLRANMEHKYQQEGVPKWPLWEEISGLMTTMGYNRNAKRCKEKWENINKYYRKVKEKNKRPRVDSKTCPYYYQLEALYGANSTKPPAAVTAEQDDDDEDQEDGDYDDEEGGYEIAGNTNSVHGGGTTMMED